MSSLVERARPQPTPLTSGYWEAAQRREYAIQRCSDCGKFVHLPEPTCPWCASKSLSYERVSGVGSVATFTIVHRTFAPGFDGRTPYVLAWVELTEQAGLRAFGNLDCGDRVEVQIGSPVEVCFERLEGFGLIPNFRLS